MKRWEADELQEWLTHHLESVKKDKYNGMNSRQLAIYEAAVLACKSVVHGFKEQYCEKE